MARKRDDVITSTILKTDKDLVEELIEPDDPKENRENMPVDSSPEGQLEEVKENTETFRKIKFDEQDMLNKKLKIKIFEFYFLLLYIKFIFLISEDLKPSFFPILSKVSFAPFDMIVGCPFLEKAFAE